MARLDKHYRETVVKKLTEMSPISIAEAESEAAIVMPEPVAAWVASVKLVNVRADISADLLRLTTDPAAPRSEVNTLMVCLPVAALPNVIAVPAVVVEANKLTPLKVSAVIACNCCWSALNSVL